MTRLLARLVALTLAAGLLVAPTIAQAKPAAPKATAPKVGTTVSTMPALTWNKANGAVSYQVQIATTAGFNPALVDITTQNLRFINGAMLPNGAYFWRLRSIDKAGGFSKWTGVRKFTKKWSATATILAPANLSAVAYPTPTILSWTPVPGASSYKVSVATGASGGGVDAPRGIISTGALAWANNGAPIQTSNTNLAVSTALHPGTYYWQVIPVDAEGHDGTASTIFSFNWVWSGVTTPTVSDMVDGVEIYDPLFQWPAIAGAASYQIEINPTSGFAPGSLVFSGSTTATQYAPLKTLPNNTYYWRVRGVDPQGQAGPWNNGPTFTKTYDETPVPGPPNLHVYNTKLELRDNTNVNEPVVQWSTVPGARTYEVQINCQGASKTYFTVNNAWTPLSGYSGGVPTIFSQPGPGISQDGPPLSTGPCFAAVRAYADNAIDGTAIAGHFAFVDFTYGGETFSNPPTSDAGASGAGRLTSADLIEPANGQIVGKTPLLCWKPSDMDPGAGITPSDHYFVYIARDPNFTTGVEAAFTSEPCWAPSRPMVDEGTLLYWQVVPTTGTGPTANWSGTAGVAGGFSDILPSFQHASVPPTPIAPVGGAAASGSVVFRWAPVPEQVKNYTIEIAQDASFSTVLESNNTDATSYSATQTFPVGATVYWRVRANNDDGKGLAWSATSTFVQTLPAPAITTALAFAGATFPALSWTPVDGATSYETQDVFPDGSVHVTSGIPSTAVSYTKMTGIGHGTVQVRAVFNNGFRSAYTATRDVDHTIPEPGGTKTQLVNKPGKLALTFAWNSKTNVKQYKVQVGRTPGFATNFLDENTDQSSYTPLLTQPDFADGGTMYWRVAVLDPDGNLGAFSKAKKFTILARLSVALSGQPPKGQPGVVTVVVTNAKGKPVAGAAVKLRGAGVKTGTHKTSKKGVVTFSVKPTKAGNLTATVTKKLFKQGSTVVPIA
ncbi:MAG TPA: Ig-like domain-containing protein [Gaiellales bacterium]|jgi:hypothetical protein